MILSTHCKMFIVLVYWEVHFADLWSLAFWRFFLDSRIKIQKLNSRHFVESGQQFHVLNIRRSFLMTTEATYHLVIILNVQYLPMVFSHKLCCAIDSTYCFTSRWQNNWLTYCMVYAIAVAFKLSTVWFWLLSKRLGYKAFTKFKTQIFW